MGQETESRVSQGPTEEAMAMNEISLWIVEVLQASDQEVGPACMNVPVPPTIRDDDRFREAYAQGFRHALSDVRAAYPLIRETVCQEMAAALRQTTSKRLPEPYTPDWASAAEFVESYAATTEESDRG